jgi:hypothetical protein
MREEDEENDLSSDMEEEDEEDDDDNAKPVPLPAPFKDEQRDGKLRASDLSNYRHSKPKAKPKDDSSNTNDGKNQELRVEPEAIINLADATPNYAKRLRMARAETIDLTSPKGGAPSTTAGPAAHDEWDCTHCTFRNRPLALVCDVCHSERKRALPGTEALLTD